MSPSGTTRYSESHEWVRQEGSLFVFGITDHAQDELSDIVYVDLPQVGASFARGAALGTIESVKAASDLYAPMGGVVVEVNRTLENTPDIINMDPLGAGWIFKFTAADAAEFDALLSAADYDRLIAA